MPQRYVTGDNKIDIEALLDHASGWGRVLLEEPGKPRFAAIRQRLRESLRDRDLPSAAKKYLTERLVTTAGATGKTSDLPKPLRDMLGNEEAQREFVADLQIGHSMLVPRMSKRDARSAVNAALDAAEEAGVPPEALKSLRSMPATRVMATAGPLATITVGALLSRVRRDPQTRQAVLMASRLSPKRLPGTVSYPQMKALPPPPGPVEPPGGAVGAAAGGGEAAAAGAVGRKGILGWLGKSWMPALRMAGAGLAVLGIRFAVKGEQARRAAGAAMRITGDVPGEYGGGYEVPTAKGPISAAQFMAAMRDRERQAKIARFNAVTQEGEYTRDVLAAITAPSPDIERLRARQMGTRLPGRIRLGSARAPVAPDQPSEDDVMRKFDAIMREAAGGA